MRKIILAAIALMLVAGCSQTVRYTPMELANFPPKEREHIKERAVSLGMTQSAVRYSWGAPKAVKVLPDENKEIWVYSRFRVNVIKLTFIDGKLTSSSSRISFNNPLKMSDKEQGTVPQDSKASTEAQGGSDGDQIKVQE